MDDTEQTGFQKLFKNKADKEINSSFVIHFMCLSLMELLYSSP